MRRLAFRAWAVVWSAVVSVTFVGVTAITLTLWFMEPDQAETTPVSDLSFFALGAIIAIGLVSQVRRPEANIAGLQQALIAIVSLGVTGLVGARAEPAVGALLLLVVVAVLILLHPHPGALLKVGPGPELRLLALSLIASVPAVWYATGMLELAASAGPSCFLGQCADGDRLAEMAAAVLAVVLVGLLAASKTPGWRLSLWCAGGGAVLIGAASLALPDVTGSLGPWWGLLAVMWGVVLVTAGQRGRRQLNHMAQPELGSASRPPITLRGRGRSPDSAELGWPD